MTNTRTRIPTHADGCIRANIPTELYRVTFAGKCEHTKIANVTIEFKASDISSARSYAKVFLSHMFNTCQIVNVEKVKS